MSYENLAIIVGNVGKMFELKTTQSDKKVLAFAVATNDKYKDANGNYQTSTEWHDIEAWNRLAEICHEQLRVGDKVYIKGKMVTKVWKDRDGKENYKKVINPQHVIFYNKDKQAQGDEEIPF